jgi:hypothetical protein
VYRLKFLVSLIALSCLVAVVVGSAQDQLTVDATGQVSPPARGRGPFPGSATPGHSTGLPIRLDLLVPTGELTPQGTALIDFRITNIGSEPITLPISIRQGSLLPKPPNTEYTMDWLTLWFTSDAITDEYLDLKGLDGQIHRLKTESPATSAELYGRSDDPQTFYSLAPNKSIVVHASSRVPLKSGTHSLTGHAELTRESILLNSNPPDTVNVTSKLLGTADSEPITKTLSEALPNSR